MKYKIEVSEVTPPVGDERYDRETVVLRQIVDELDVHDLAVYINEPLRANYPELKEIDSPVPTTEG